MMFNQRTLSTHLALGSILIAKVAGDTDYGVYFDPASDRLPNGHDNPLGVEYEPHRPERWSEVDRKGFPFDWYAFMDDNDYRDNKCENRSIKKCTGDCQDLYEDQPHKQSPIQVQYDDQVDRCDDRHEFHTPTDGICGEGDVDFLVTPTGLLADFKCEQQPTLDYSRNPNPWIFKHVEVKVPAEHEHKLENGQVLKYPGELHLVHRGTPERGNADDIGIVAVWLDDEKDQHNDELERYIEKWEEALEDAHLECNMKFDRFKCTNGDSTGGGGGGGGGGNGNNCKSERISNCCKAHSRRLVDEKWYPISFDDFEDGESSFNLDQSALIRSWGSVNGQPFYESKRYSLRLQKSSQVTQTKVYNVKDYEKLRIKFFVMFNGVEKGEALTLQYHDGYGSWQKVKSWEMGENILLNNKPHREEVILTTSNFEFRNEVRLRFTTNGSGSSDKWYLDDILFEGSREPTDDGDKCSKDEIVECCNIKGRQLEEIPLLRGLKKELSPESRRSIENDRFPKHPNRRLGYNCRRNQGDYFCPYSLYEETDNPYYHRYYGSLTSPPCTESVRWRVMIDPLQISKNQLKRLELLTANYVDKEKCELGTWGEPRGDGTCRVDVNRPIQYLSRKHEVEDCEKYHDGGEWNFEATEVDIASNFTETNHANSTNTTSHNAL